MLWRRFAQLASNNAILMQGFPARRRCELISADDDAADSSGAAYAADESRIASWLQRRFARHHELKCMPTISRGTSRRDPESP
jgi:hypothetical protein